MVRDTAAAVLQRACDDPALKGWLSSEQDTATMSIPEVQAVFDLLYAFRDEVSWVTGMRMPSSMDPQYPYGQADTEASLSQVLTNQQALSWRATELRRRDAEGARLASKKAAAPLQHLRQVDPELSPATMQELCDALDHQLQQLDQRVEELRGALARIRHKSIKDCS